MKITASLYNVGLVFLMTTNATADSITLQAVADNTLYDDLTGSLSNGHGPTFFAGNTGGNLTRRGLIKFGIAPVPSEAVVDSVSLSLFLYQAQSTPVSIELHRVLQAWGEGSSATGFRGGGGANATTGDATWLHNFYATSYWSTPGGDFAASPSASTSVDSEGTTYTWNNTPSLVADVQSWLDNSSTNYGWLLKGDETQGGTAKAFASRDISNLALRPALSVTYHVTSIPEPGTCLSLIGALSIFTQLRLRDSRKINKGYSSLKRQGW